MTTETPAVAPATAPATIATLTPPAAPAAPATAPTESAPAAAAAAAAVVVAPVAPVVTAPAAATAPATAPVVPEKYDFKVPEEYYDPTIAERVSANAKALKLSAVDAQKLLDTTLEEVKAFNQSVMDGMEHTVADWDATVKADKEIGGDNLNKSLELGKAVLTKFGSPELIKMLESTRIGGHPEVIRLFAKLGRSMKEDDLIIPGSNQGGGAKDVASLLYDNPTSQSK